MTEALFWRMEAERYMCSDPPPESCSDAGCPTHGDSDDAWWAADERDDDD